MPSLSSTPGPRRRAVNRSLVLWFGLLASCLLWLLPASSARAQVPLGQETFEGATSDVGYTTSTPFPAVLGATDTSIALEYFQRINQVPGATYQPWSSDGAILGNQQGSYFWGGEAVRGNNSVVTRPAGFVQLTGINTAGYTNLTITVAFSAPRGNGYPRIFGARGVKREDQVKIQYSFDGTNYTDAGRITGSDPTANNSGFWKRDVNLSGDASDDATEPILNMNFTDYQFNVPAIGNLLRVRIVADYLNSTHTELAFDNIRVAGTVDTTPRPVLALGASESTTPLAYTEGVSGSVLITNTLAVTYPSGTTLTGATVKIQSGYAGSQDLLRFANQNGISGTYAGGTLTLTGTTTPANYQAALRSVTYQNTNSTTATGGTRSIDFTVRNGTFGSNTETRAIAVDVTLNDPVPLPYTEGFEADGEGTRYTATTFANAASLTGFFRTTSNPPVGPGGVAFSTAFSGYTGSAFWYGEGTIPAPTPKGVLQLAPVDATGRSNLQFTIAVGSAGNWLEYNDFFNPGDSFELFYRLNGGTPVKFGAFHGVDGNTPPRQDLDLNRLTPATGTQLGQALRDFTFDLPAAAAVGNLDFILRLESRGTSEIAFDNIRITGLVPATVTTISLGAISNTSATVGGDVTDAGGGTVTERGVVYSATNQLPTIGGADVTKNANGAGLGQFGRVITGLQPNTTYYVRAYAINGMGPAYGNVEWFATPTTVVSINRNNPTLTNLAAVSYTVTFGNSVSGVSASNFSLTTVGLTGAGIDSVSGTGATRTVKVNTGTGNGSLTLNMINADGLYPNFSNPFPFTGQSYTIDKTAPTISGVAVPANATYGVGQNLNFTVAFSSAVTVTTTGGTPGLGLTVGSSSRTASYVSGSGTSALIFRYTVVVGDLDANGIGLASALTLNGGLIQDATAKNAALTLSGVPSTVGVLVDGVVPTVTSFSGPAASGSTTGTTPFAFSVSFSEPVTGFSSAGLTVTNGSITSGPSGSGAGPYAFTVTPATAGMPTTVLLAANAAQDAAGNGNPATTDFILTYTPPIPPPTISRITPPSGPVGTNIVLTGTNFTGVNQVTFNGAPAAGFVVDSATQITVSVPSAATTGPVVVTGNGLLSNEVIFTVTHAPIASGQSATTAEDTAQPLILAGTDTDGDALTYAVVTAPAHGTLSGTGSRRIYTPVANYNGLDAFTFTANDGTLTSAPATVSLLVTAVNDAPAFTSASVNTAIAKQVAYTFTPAANDVDGDILVFSLVGGPTGAILNPATGTFSWTPTSSQAGATYSFAVQVSDGRLVATQPWELTVVNNSLPLRLTGFSPAAQSVGQEIVLTGGGLSAVTDVLFSGTSTSQVVFTIVNDTKITATVPAWAIDGPLTVISSGARVTSSGSFTVLPAAPTIASFPGTGYVGQPITITGTNFTAPTTVKFVASRNTTVDGTNVRVISPTSLQVTVPAGAITGKFTLTTSGGTAQSATPLTILLPVPTVTAIAPPQGMVGQEVTLSGTNLANATVAFAFKPGSPTKGTAMIKPGSNTNAQLVVFVPSDAATGKITVTTAWGTTSSSSRFTVVPGTPARPSAQASTATGPAIQLQAFPNPFQDRVLLRFALEREQPFALRVYDARGVLVQELGTGTARGGEVQQLAWDGRYLAEGLYLVRLTTATRTQTLRLVLQR